MPDPGSRNLTVDQTRQQEKRSYVLILLEEAFWYGYAMLMDFVLKFVGF